MPVALSSSSAKPPRPDPNTSAIRGRSAVLVSMNSAASLALEKSSGEGEGGIVGKSYLLLPPHSTLSLLSQGRPHGLLTGGPHNETHLGARALQVLENKSVEIPEMGNIALTNALLRLTLANRVSL